MTAGKKETLLLTIAGIIPITWLGLKFAPFYDQGLITAFGSFDEIIAEPLAIDLCRDSLRSVLLFNLIYLMGMESISQCRRTTGEARNTDLPDGVMHQR